MALQYSETGEVRSLVLAEPPRRDRRAVALENFISTFAVQFELRAKGVPTDPEFCPIRTVSMIEVFLRQLTQSLPLFLLRVKLLVKRTRRVQEWFRSFLASRNENIRQIFERWVASDVGHKKALRNELYRDTKLCQAAFRTRLKTYLKLHNPKEAMYATVISLYWKRREEFHRQFRSWNTALNSALREQQRLRGLLRQARKGAVVVRSDGLGIGSRRPGEEAAVLVGTLELRLSALQEDLLHIMARRPRFNFTVKTVSRSELLAAVCRPRPLTVHSSERPGSPSMEEPLTSPPSSSSERSSPAFPRSGTWSGQEDVAPLSPNHVDFSREACETLPRLTSPMKRERAPLGPPSPQAMRVQFLSEPSIPSSESPPSRGGPKPLLPSLQNPSSSALPRVPSTTIPALHPCSSYPSLERGSSFRNTPTPSSPLRPRKLCALLTPPQLSPKAPTPKL
eukprot:RCo024077